LNFDPTSRRFVLPDDDVKTEEVFNRTITACYLAKTAYAIYKALEEDDAEFRYKAFSELALRACTEVLYQQQMPAVMAEFAQRSPRHAAIVQALDTHFVEEKAFFTELIEKARGRAGAA